LWYEHELDNESRGIQGKNINTFYNVALCDVSEITENKILDSW
jgi:uncharacterized Fe-S cluster protein YjdI